jgi:hypothetical protein
MKKHFLLTVLVLPLALAAAVLMAAGFCVAEPWRGLFVNLAAGLVGSVITVFYVEKIIRRNEQREWTRVMGHVGRQVNILANSTTSSVRAALGLKMPASFRETEVIGDPRRSRIMMLDLIECDLLPQISGLGQMNQEDWCKFANSMIGSVKDAERILSLFSKSIDPVLMGLILDIHEKSRALVLQYQTWPDMLGVPFAQMKPNNRGESMVPYFKAVYDIVIQDAEQLLRICANLLREINLRFPNPEAAKNL